MIKPNRPLRKLQAAFIIYAAFILVLAGCRSVPSSTGSEPSAFSRSNPETLLISKETPYPPITVETYRNKTYPIIWHLVTIDLSDSSLSLTAAPLSVSSEGIVKGETTADFAKRTGSIVAINASPFSVPDDKPLFATADRQPSGLFISDGQLISEPMEQYGALGFTRDNRAFIMESQTEALPEDTSIVLGGFWVIIRNGEHYDSFKNFQDSRTAAGISQDGLTLYLLSVEGEQPLISKGLSYYECAEILLEAGASEAVELDGGGSESLIIQGKNHLYHQTSRLVANNLGIFVTIGID